MEFLTIDPKACAEAAFAIAEIGHLAHTRAEVETHVIYERLHALMQGHTVLTQISEALAKSPTLAVNRAGGE